MPLLELEIVPNERPNADGEWIVADVPKHCNPFDFVPKENYHVVKYNQHTGYPIGDGFHA
jgi:hypothetical protein